MDQGALDAAAGRARLLDELAVAATIAPDQERIAGWWCKAAPELPFRRCNAVLPSLGAGGDAEACRAALDVVRGWYDARGLRLIVQVSEADPTVEALDHLLATEGLRIEAPVHVLARSIDGRRTDGSGPSPTSVGSVHVVAGIDEAWAGSYGRLHGGDERQQERTAAYGRMLRAHGEHALGASLAIDGEVVGVGFGVVDRGWVGIYGMATAPTRRRRGVATAVLGALQAAAWQAGATSSYLLVEVDNGPALGLYRQLGFARSHGYHYRSSAEAGDRA